MLLTWMNRWVCRLELEMIGWDLGGRGGGYVTGYLKTKMMIWILNLTGNGKKLTKALVDTVWLRVKRSVRDRQSLPDVFKAEKEDHLFFYERKVKTECVMVEGLERSNRQGKDLRQNQEQVPVRVT